MAFPTITEKHGTFTCGFPRDLPFVFPSVADEVTEEDPGWFTGVDLDAATSHTAADALLSDPAVIPEEVSHGVPDDH